MKLYKFQGHSEINLSQSSNSQVITRVEINIKLPTQADTRI